MEVTAATLAVVTNGAKIGVNGDHRLAFRLIEFSEVFRTSAATEHEEYIPAAHLPFADDAGHAPTCGCQREIKVCSRSAFLPDTCSPLWYLLQGSLACNDYEAFTMRWRPCQP